MAVRLMLWPFRVEPTGAVATADDASPEYYAGEISQMLLTNWGERRMVPQYGVISPAFGYPDKGELQSQCALFGPPVSIDSITIDTGAVYIPGQESYTVSFSVDDEDDF